MHYIDYNKSGAEKLLNYLIKTAASHGIMQNRPTKKEIMFEQLMNSVKTSRGREIE